jgi:hypothetical protein
MAREHEHGHWQPAPPLRSTFATTCNKHNKHHADGPLLPLLSVPADRPGVVRSHVKAGTRLRFRPSYAASRTASLDLVVSPPAHYLPAPIPHRRQDPLPNHRSKRPPLLWLLWRCAIFWSHFDSTPLTDRPTSLPSTPFWSSYVPRLVLTMILDSILGHRISPHCGILELYHPTVHVSPHLLAAHGSASRASCFAMSRNLHRVLASHSIRHYACGVSSLGKSATLS